MTSRRELQLAIALCLLGSVLTLVGASQVWVTVTLPGALTIVDLRHGVTGQSLAPGLRALGLLGLAGVVAIAATRRAGRLVVGALLLAAGIVVCVQAAQRLREVHAFTEAVGQVRGCQAPCLGSALDLNPTGIWITLVGGGLLAAAGLLVVVRGRGWAGLSSSYDAPGAVAEPPVTDKGVWDALDRGDDPTA